LIHRIPKLQLILGGCAIALFAFAAAADHHEADEAKAEPTVAEQILGMEAMCHENADAMAARQTEKSLCERLGGEEKIREITAEVIRLHGENDQFTRFMPDVDTEHLVKAVTQFLVAGTGGPGEYTGLAMPEAHAHLKLTNADFLAAGADVMKAMTTKGCGEAEIQEILCALLSFRAAVVIDSEKEVK